MRKALGLLGMIGLTADDLAAWKMRQDTKKAKRLAKNSSEIFIERIWFFNNTILYIGLYKKPISFERR